MHGALEVAPEGRRLEQAGIGIDDALGLERFQDALELTFERLQAHEWKDSLDQAHRIGVDPHQIGQPFVIDRGIVQHADRKVAKSRILGEQGQQTLNHARAQALRR